MTSIEIKILLLLALGASVYLFITETRRSQRVSALVEWVREHHHAAWEALPWTMRNINRLGGVIYLHRNGRITHPRFRAAYEAVRPFRPDQLVAFAIAAAGIALVVVGVSRWGWQW